MQDSRIQRRLWQKVVALAFLGILVAAILFVMGAENPAQSAAPIRATNASAEQDMRMLMHEQELERFDKLNFNPSAVQLVVTPNSVIYLFDASSIACYEPRPSCDR